MARLLLFASLGIALALTGALGSSSPAAPGVPRTIPVPAQTLRQIKAEYGQFTYVPGFAPRGFIFTSWRIDEPAQSFLVERLSITFGRLGTRLIWTVSDGRDTDDYADCSKRPFYDFKRSIGRRLVYYALGNHGDIAWTCFSAASTSGYRQPVGIDLWIANEPGRPSRLIAMRMVASARRA